jgi:hypothetical protein
LGALATLLETKKQNDLFPNVDFPPEYNTAVLKAAYLFSYLTCAYLFTLVRDKLIVRCYLITHAHLDHTLSLILLSGSVPPRPSIARHPQPPIPPKPAGIPKANKKATNDAKTCVPVFGTKETLDRLSSAYGGGLWPELGHWANWRVTEEPKLPEGRTRSKKRKVEVSPVKGGDGIPPNTCGVALTPYVLC